MGPPGQPVLSYTCALLCCHSGCWRLQMQHLHNMALFALCGVTDLHSTAGLQLAGCALLCPHSGCWRLQMQHLHNMAPFALFALCGVMHVDHSALLHLFASEYL